MKNILVVAPHPDDETLGCAGTLLKLKEQGACIEWLIVTCINPTSENSTRIATRKSEIEQVQLLYNFAQTHMLDIPTTRVGEVPFSDLVGKIGGLFEKIKPELILIPFCNDAHTDHYYTSKAVLSCCKWFRHSDIQSVLYYETPSETNFNLNSAETPFSPNIYVDITPFWEKKIEILNIYKSELGDFPFPRSVDALQALAMLRGSECGAKRAEAFQLLRGVF